MPAVLTPFASYAFISARVLASFTRRVLKYSTWIPIQTRVSRRFEGIVDGQRKEGEGIERWRGDIRRREALF
jgi:hypothetical protein